MDNGMFGGLLIIKSRLLWDILTVSILLYNSIAPFTNVHFSILIILSVGTFQSVGLFQRWTVTFPMMMYGIVYLLKHWVFYNMNMWKMILSVILVCLECISLVLTLLFPPLSLRPVKGKYRVGVVDFHLPITPEKLTITSTNITSVPEPSTCDANSLQNSNFVSVRLLYPTDQITTNTIPYLHQTYKQTICNELMKIASPPPLKAYGFILHYWLLNRLNLQKHAPILSSHKEKFPMAVFSHGMVGISEIYSHQGMTLAANGTVVLMVTHSDGSAPVMELKDGSLRYYDPKFGKLLGSSDDVTTRKWRNAVAKRSIEYIAATKAFLALNTKNIPHLENLGISLVEKCNSQDITFMGHSFGGSTALFSAWLCPDLATRVAVLDPCVEWLPDLCRWAFFYDYATKNDKSNDGSSGLADSLYDGGSTGYELLSKEEMRKNCGDCLRFGDMDMLILYSHEWIRASSKTTKVLLFMSQKAILGKPKSKNGLSQFDYISEAHHSEFSDVPALTPLWIARPAKSTGKRNPLDTLEESSEKVQKFLQKCHAAK